MKITLIEKNINKNTTVEFLKNPLEIEDNKNIEIVYQDREYLLKIDLLDFDIKYIEDINIFVNDEKIKYFKKSGDYIYDLNMVFNLIYGMTDIRLEITIQETIYYYYSSILGVAIENNPFNKSLEKSLVKMLNYIYQDKNSSYLLKRTKEIASKDNNDNDLILDSKSDNLYQELNLLEKIHMVYKQMYMLFLHNQKNKTINQYNIDRSEKLNNISANTIKYIITNPSELKLITNSTNMGITINNKQYMLEKTLVHQPVFTSDTYENRVIIMFLNTIILRIGNLIKKIKDDLNNNNLENKYDKNSLELNYMIPSKFIYMHMNDRYDKFLTQFEKLYNQFSEMIILYKKILYLDTSDICHHSPKSSSIFREIYHYREIYNVILKWFYTEDIKTKKVEKLHFYSADKIYELYSLINIIKAINSYLNNLDDNYECDINNVILDIKNNSPLYFIDNINKEDIKDKVIIERTKFDYYYDIKNSLYTNTPYKDKELYNTYHFIKGDVHVFLYYQARIFKSKDFQENYCNNIYMQCVGNEKYYIPDFVIKSYKVSGYDNNKNEIYPRKRLRYGIFDSKWRIWYQLTEKDKSYSQEVDFNNGAFKDTIRKYIKSTIIMRNISKENNLNKKQFIEDSPNICETNTDFMFLLKGKISQGNNDDRDKKIFYTHDQINENFYQNIAERTCGIIPLHTETDITLLLEALKNILLFK